MARDPLQLVDLTTARTDFEAEVLVHALKSEGIPAQAFTVAGSALQWEVAASQPIRVQVRRCDLDKARLALARVRQESVDFDWSELEADDFDEVCPRCQYPLKDLPDRTRCPECGYTAPLGGPAAAAARRPRRGDRLWTAVAVVLLGAILIPLLVHAAWLLFGVP